MALTSARGMLSRVKRAHWALACGWERTTATSPSAISSRAISEVLTAKSYSPTITTSAVSNASVSSVTRTEPSTEFSNGTRARSASRFSTARIAL